MFLKVKTVWQWRRAAGMAENSRWRELTYLLTYLLKCQRRTATLKNGRSHIGLLTDCTWMYA